MPFDRPLNLKKFFVGLLILMLCLSGGRTAFAQQRTDSTAMQRKATADSLAQARKARADSLAAQRKYRESKRYTDSVAALRNARLEAQRAAMKSRLDSAAAVRKVIADSTAEVRKAASEALRNRLKSRSDSLAAIRKHKESRKYRDSVERARNARLDSIRSVRTAILDSARNSRKRILDSATAARKLISDSVRAVQKQRSDSLARIRKYRESKRYRDSVQVTRQSRLDSIRAVRKIYTDNILSQRKKTQDSLAKYRKARTDSLTAARKLRMDSLQRMRDIRADSLAKRKELREKELRARQKKKEEKAKLSLEIKIKKKQNAWSNEKMLKKKWGPVRRTMQNVFTRYNYFFNANNKMEEAERNMLRRKKDDFEKVIDLFPFDPNIDSAVFASDMDTIIRKASVGIQIHDPRTKWADDLYLLMGKAFYYKGNYDQAEKVFKYVVGLRNATFNKKKKKKQSAAEQASAVEKEKGGITKLFRHRSVHNDAILWLTRTYVTAGRTSDAEAILDLLDASSFTTASMRGKIALERANLYAETNSFRAASRELTQVTRSKAVAKPIRLRASFLNGQLLSNMSQYDSAAFAFKQNINLHPQIEMDFYARKYMAAAVAESGADQTKTIAALKKMLKDGKYQPYYEQVYFILGRLSANADRLPDAMKYYELSLQQPKATRKQKAITYASLGNLQYRLGQYGPAQKSYDSAAYFAKGVADNSEVALALRRGKSLGKLREPYEMKMTADSLLRLAAMSERDQRAVIKKYLKYLEQRKADSIANASAATASASAASMTGGSGNWYFSSTAAVQQGFSDFKRRWGSRPLVDNWRRGNVAQSSSSTVEDTSDVNETADPALTEDALLAAIPQKESDIERWRKRLRTAYLDMADAYINEADEYLAGVATLDTLKQRFPNHEYPDRELALRYTAMLRMNKPDDAERLREQLLQQFPQSEYAQSLRGNVPDPDENAKEPAESVAGFYEATYDLTMARDYKAVVVRTAKAKRSFGDPNYTRKFRVLEAIAYAGDGDYKRADTLVKQYLKDYPTDSLRPWVDAVGARIEQLKAADTLDVDTAATSAAGATLGTSAASLGTAIKADTGLSKTTVPLAFALKPKEEHYAVFLFKEANANTAGVRAGMADFARMKFSAATLDFTQEPLDGKKAMVIVRGFKTAAAARAFLNQAKAEPLLFRAFAKDDYKAFIISASNFLKLKADKQEDDYLKFYKQKY